MISMFHVEISIYPEYAQLKLKSNELHRELSDSNYDVVIGTCNEAIEICQIIRINAVNMNDERTANTSFLLKKYFSVFKYYSRYWQLLLQKKYKDSWITLQDTIGTVSTIYRFLDKQNECFFECFLNHLYELEKLYPYNVFASIEAVVREKRCSICNKSMLDTDCLHIPGEIYWGEMAVGVIKDAELQAVALVKNPANKRCVMELADDTRSEEEKFMVLDYFIANNKDPLRIFSLNQYEKLIYNDGYDKAGRNDPCICGSGRKFKKCCGQYKYEKGIHNHFRLGNRISLEEFTLE
ncbi:YecA family protein [Marinicrinis sediminis]|uniref:SEC-C metal-binding domain-containing protein n=1 Tax=Marinicrinis sediminis TaxID=1652465 RepID=A0ABW5R5F2_9BACL